MSPIARRVPCPIDVVAPYQVGSDNEEEITRNLEGLTHGIPQYDWVGDIPRQYQRHMVGVSDQICRLPTRAARAVSRYHDYHAD